MTSTIGLKMSIAAPLVEKLHKLKPCSEELFKICKTSTELENKCKEGNPSIVDKCASDFQRFEIALKISKWKSEYNESKRFLPREPLELDKNATEMTQELIVNARIRPNSIPEACDILKQIVFLPEVMKDVSVSRALFENMLNFVAEHGQGENALALAKTLVQIVPKTHLTQKAIRGSIVKASGYGNLQIVKLLCDISTERRGIFVYDRVLEEFLGRFADQHPLFVAIHKGHPETVKYLFNLPELVNSERILALEYAKEVKNEKIASLLTTLIKGEQDEIAPSCCIQ